MPKLTLDKAKRLDPAVFFVASCVVGAGESATEKPCCWSQPVSLGSVLGAGQPRFWISRLDSEALQPYLPRSRLFPRFPPKRRGGTDQWCLDGGRTWSRGKS